MLLAGVPGACNKLPERACSVERSWRFSSGSASSNRKAYCLRKRSSTNAPLRPSKRGSRPALRRCHSSQLRAQDKGVCFCKRNTLAYLFGTCSTSRKRGTGRFEDASDGLFLLSRLKSRFVCAPGRPAGGGLPGLRRLRPVTVPLWCRAARSPSSGPSSCQELGCSESTGSPTRAH